MYKYLIIILLLITACKPEIINRETFIRDTTYIVKPEVIRIKDTVVRADSNIIEYFRANYNRTDTLVYIKYLPREKYIDVIVKPDTIKLFKRDTLYKKTTENIINETPFLSKLGIFLVGCIFGLISLIIYYIYYKKGI